MQEESMFTNQIDAINREIARVKENLENYFSDSNIPLKERWSNFLKTPSYLKNHHSYVWHFENDPEDKLIGFEGSLFHAERCETINTSGLFEYNEDVSEETISKLKEEILQSNLGSFVYDW